MVDTFNPGSETNQRPVTLTQNAIEYVRAELAKADARGMRFAAKKSGCSGYRYVVEYVQDDASSDDRVFNFDDVKVYVSNEDMLLLEGTEIDFVQQGLNKVIQFNNPSAEHTCGCGESFGF